jgi:hypothetical protein
MTMFSHHDYHTTISKYQKAHRAAGSIPLYLDQRCHLCSGDRHFLGTLALDPCPNSDLLLILVAFPNLTDDNHRETGKFDPAYNCVGFLIAEAV